MEMSASYGHYIYELTAENGAAPQPEGCGVSLYRHQLVLLQRLRDMERGTIQINNASMVRPATAALINADIQPTNDDWFEEVRGTDLDSRVGVIGDKVGAGKSFVILALAHGTRANQIASSDEPVNRTFAQHRITLSTMRRPTCVMSLTIVVIPHTLCNQWSDYLVRCCGTWSSAAASTF
jgi:hypothetical protein